MIEHGKDILLFYEKHKWDNVDHYSRRSISGFMAWYTLLVRALKGKAFRVHENNYALAASHPDYPVGLVGTPVAIPGWSLQNPAILGPCMYDNPKQNPTLMKDPRFKGYILTCDWLKKLFEPYYGDKCILWSAGIDTDEWPDTKIAKKDIDVLVYDKIRWERAKTVEGFLGPVIAHLRKMRLTCQVLTYNNITHDEYREALSRSRCMVFMCEHETQGIAYHEALASNVPIIAWDYGWWTDPIWPLYLEAPAQASSVPNFSPACGVKFKMIADFPSTFERFWFSLDKYTPREYIKNELSLTASADCYAGYYFALAS